MGRLSGILVFLSVATASSLYAQGTPAATASPRQIVFQQNAGQFSPTTVFETDGVAGSLRIDRAGAVSLNGSPIRLSNPRRVDARGEQPTGAAIRYLHGGDPRRWIEHVASFEQVTLPGILPGIDWTWRSEAGALEYDFVVHPGADPREIELRFDRSARIRILDGDLIVTAGRGATAHRRPRAYQDVGGVRRPVTAGWRVSGRRARFAVGAYDARYPLVIDPVLAWSQYLGGGVGNVNGDGVHARVAGDGSLVMSSANANDVVVSRYSAAGALIFSTSMGGGGFDTAYGVAIDSSGRIFVAGETISSDFPVLNAAQPTAGGNVDAFVAALNPSGSLVFSTFAGGTNVDRFYSLTLGPDASLWTTGATFSGDFPSPNGFRSSLVTEPVGRSTAPNAVVEHLTRDGQMVMASYLATCGDHGYSIGEDIAVASDGSPYIAAFCAVNPFPPLGFLPVLTGLQSVVKLNPQNGSTVWVRSFGNGILARIAVSSDQLIWAAGAADPQGSTSPASLTPTTPDAYDSVCGTDGICNGKSDGFLMALDSSGNEVYGTFLGGAAHDSVSDIGTSSSGWLWIAGVTASTDWPDTQSSIAPDDGFVMRLSLPSRAVNFTARFGGNGDDSVHTIAPDAAGGAYLAGITRSSDLPARRNALAASSDRFLAYYAPLANVMTIDRPVNGAVVSPEFDIGGWAIDDRSPSGPGFDAIHVWAFPIAPAGAPFFVGVAQYGTERQDVAAIFGSRFAPSGYRLDVAIAPGIYVFGVYGHSTATNSFDTIRTVTFNVADQTHVTIDTPPDNASVTSPLKIGGWAIDLGAGTGTGIDRLDVWAWPQAGGAPVFAGTPTYGVERPDVAAIFGERFRFSGYDLTVSLPPGTYTLAAYPHRAGRETFGAPAISTVTIQPAPSR